MNRSTKSAKLASTRLLLLHSMRNCSGTGGSKDRFSWNDSFATRQTNEISGLPRQVNISRLTRRNRSLSPLSSTWGENGHLAVWLDPSNAWIYPHLHAAAEKMSELARKYGYQIVGQSRKHSGSPGAGPAGEATGPQVTDRVLKQLARELLLAQSSDWAFLMKTGSAREYATKRTTDHLDRFCCLHDQFVTKNLDEEFLRDCEWRDNIFPNVNWRYYA